MKKILCLLFALLVINVSTFAQTTYSSGIDVNFFDVGIAMNQSFDNLNIRATVGYPLFAILKSYEKFDQAEAQDFFETVCFHGNINYKVIDFHSFFINLGLGSDVFMQFDFSKENSHYTYFGIGPYGEIGYSFKNEDKEFLKLSYSMTFSLVRRENKHTDYLEPEVPNWNKLIGFNDSLFYSIMMIPKLHITIPF